MTAWSILKEAAMHDLMASGVPYHTALTLADVEDSEVEKKKEELLKQHRGEHPD